MKDYTSEAPVWSDTIPTVEENDLVNADNNNAAAIQLLQNILVLAATKVNKEEGKSLVSETERNLWNMIYQQATGYTDQKIADLINGAPSTLDTLGEIASAMGENADVVEALEEAIGNKANAAEMESLLGTKLEKTGDSKDNTVTFTSSDTLTPSGWTDVAVLKSGETHKSFVQKVATMIKNVRYLWKLIGNTDISKIGDGTVTGALNSLNTGTNAIAARLGNDYGPFAIIPTVDETVFKNDSSWVQKKNGIVIVHIYGMVNVNAPFELLTLPKGLRPWSHVRADGAIIYNDDGKVTSSGTILDNGIIRISGQAGKWVSFTIAYPAAN